MGDGKLDAPRPMMHVVIVGRPCMWNDNAVDCKVFAKGQPVHFADRLFAAVRRTGAPIVVGIDPRPEDLPPGFLDQFPSSQQGVAEALQRFGEAVIDVIAPLVPAVKFQAAYYEAYGPLGMAALHASVESAYARGLIVIFDGKRNDIGSTAEAYARAYLGKVPLGESYGPVWNVDALTINSYLGSDGVVPFLKVAAREDKGAFSLVRTSNPSAVEFQDLLVDGKPLYRHVAERTARWGAPHRGETSGYSLLGAVVGATYPEELAELRAALPGVPFLVPGYGAQGGTAKNVASAFDADGLGALVNSSRGITRAFERPAFRAQAQGHWQTAIEQAVRDMIDDLAANTPAARLRERPGAGE